MTDKFILRIKSGQRVFINGAVLRFDRKVAIELMNDAVFLLEQHVLLPGESKTPLRQLYLIVQAMLMAPESRRQAEPVYFQQMENLERLYSSAAIKEGLGFVRQQFTSGRLVEVLKTIRKMLPIEAEVLKLPADGTLRNADSSEEVETAA